MRNSSVPFKQLLRALLLAVPVLLLLGLNGRTVTVRRPVAPAGAQASAGRETVIKERVALEAASPLVHYVAPALLAWLPAVVPAAGPLRLLRRAVAAAPAGAPAAHVAQLCRQRRLAAALWAQAP